MNAHNYLTSIIKSVAGLNGSAPEFTKVAVKDEHYHSLYKKAERAAEKGPGIYIIHVDVDEYILAVRVRITINSSHTIGCSDEYGNVERVCLSTFEAEVVPGPEAVMGFYMIDMDGDFMQCDFDPDNFENMFL